MGASPGNGPAAIKAPAAIDRWPRGIAYRNGFRILGTPLGFKSATNNGLNFISNVNDKPPGRGTRVITSRFLASVMDMEDKGVDALILDFGHQIRLGRMGIQLYPAGLGPGSTQLEISFQNRRILYCGGVSVHQPLNSPPCATPECDLLLLDTVTAEPKPPAPGSVTKPLLTWIQYTHERRRVPIVTFGNLTAALDVCWMLASNHVAIRTPRATFELFRRAASQGAQVPRLHQLRQTLPPKEVVLVAAERWPSSRFFNAPTVMCAYAGPGREGATFSVDTAFRLGEGADRPSLVSYVRETRAAQVALGPDCDEALAKLLQKAGIETYRLAHPAQMPLPF
jgi:hypothetical protein